MSDPDDLPVTLPFRRQRAVAIALGMWALSVLCIYGALTSDNGFRPMLLFWAPFSVLGAVVATWGALLRNSGLTIDLDGLTYQRRRRVQHFSWSQIEQVEALDVTSSFSSIHLTVRGEPSTLTLAPANLAGGTNRAITEIRRFVELANADVHVVDSRPSARVP